MISDENKHEQEKFYKIWKDKVNQIAFQQCYDFSKMSDTQNHAPEDNGIEAYCCSQLWQLLAITHEGDVLPCMQDYGHENVLGNLKTHTIYECWHSPKLKKFRRLHLENKWRDISMCKRCVNCLETGK